MSWSKHEYLEAYAAALAIFLDELRTHNRPEVVHRVLSEVKGKRDTVTFTHNMRRAVKIMDLCQDVIGQQSDHPARYFSALTKRGR